MGVVIQQPFMADEKDKKSKKEDMTPEEKLFRVIVTGGQDLDLNAEQEKPESEKSPKSWVVKIGKIPKLLIEKMGRGMQALKGKWGKPSAAGSSSLSLADITAFFSLRRINKALLVVIVLLVLYLILDLSRLILMPHPKHASDHFHKFNLKLLSQWTEKISPPITEYLDAAKKRNIFIPAPQTAETHPTTPAAPGEENLRLVGISWDKNEYVAMIEISGELGAHFVRKGDTVKDNIKVEEIKEYSVHLSKGEKQWDLS